MCIHRLSLSPSLSFVRRSTLFKSKRLKKQPAVPHQMRGCRIDHSVRYSRARRTLGGSPRNRRAGVLPMLLVLPNPGVSQQIRCASRASDFVRVQTSIYSIRLFWGGCIPGMEASACSFYFCFLAWAHGMLRYHRAVDLYRTGTCTIRGQRAREIITNDR